MKTEAARGCRAEGRVKIKSWVFQAVVSGPPPPFCSPCLAYLGHSCMFGSISASRGTPATPGTAVHRGGQ